MRHRKIKGYGWRPDTPDRRDYTLNFRRLVSPGQIPVKLDQRDTGFFPPVFDQGALGSCTGNGWAGAVAYMMRSQKLPDLGPANIPSRLMIYYGEREVEGSVGYDSGAEIRDGIKVVAQRGVCDESEWPYDITKFTERPPDVCYTDAAKHLVKQYGRIPQNENDMRATLTAGYPIVIGFTVYTSFESAEVARSGTVPMPTPEEQVLGGHCVVLCGFDFSLDAPIWICRNSWGAGWGEGGYFTMPKRYLLDPDLSSDFWAAELVS